MDVICHGMYKVGDYLFHRLRLLYDCMQWFMLRFWLVAKISTYHIWIMVTVTTACLFTAISSTNLKWLSVMTMLILDVFTSNACVS